MKTFSLKLPESLLAGLTAAAHERGESRSALVREAIRAMIAGDGTRSEGSCLDLASDLAGCAEGRLDLSVSEEHMRGYGQ